MSELQRLLDDIDKLCENLHAVINKKGINLTNPEIISASQMLDAAITKYNEIINKKHT